MYAWRPAMNWHPAQGVLLVVDIFVDEASTNEQEGAFPITKD